MTTTAMKIFGEIRNYPVISTHCHHLPDEEYTGADLRFVLKNSYAGWVAPPPDFKDMNAVAEYISRYRCNSYFRWLFAALEELYRIPFRIDTVEALDDAVKRAYVNQNHHLNVLNKDCRYVRVVNERQPSPGSNLNHPELFSPSARCDCYFSGYVRDKAEPNGFYPYSSFENPDISTLAEYIGQMRLAIANYKKNGSVALKVAIAYERPLRFENTSAAAAAKAFNNPHATPGEINDFGDYVMFEIAAAAAENDLPLQIHTGMGILDATNPMGLLKLIRSNPETKFHLLHGGFPWTDDTYALLSGFENVWSDTCWLPYLSTRRAREYLITALEVSDAYRLTWGCDAWMPEDSKGALTAMENVLSEALAEMVDDGAFNMSYALFLANRILYHNARGLFNI